MCFTIVDRVVDAINSCEELDLPLVRALDACEAGESSMLDEITARFDAVSECRARVPGFLDGVLGFSKSECVTEWPVGIPIVYRAST